MRGKIIDVNYQKGLAVFEDTIGDYGYFDILGSDNLERDDVIIGNLNNLGGEVIIKDSTGERINVFIEDFGMSMQVALSQVFGN